MDKIKSVGHVHHGSVQLKSTQTLVTEIYSQLVQNLENGEDTILLQLDQSKAFEVVDHRILINKIRALGFKEQATKLMISYLQDRKQYVHISGFDSDRLDIGPQSVIQGSTLSCTLFLIFIIDMTMMFHSSRHSPEQQINCNRENQNTFVDDNSIVIKKESNRTLSESVQSTMQKVQNYMEANLLELNPSKTTILVVTKNKKTRNDLKVNLGGKEIYKSKSLKLLGNTINEELSWENQVLNELIPSLNNRLRTLRINTKYLPDAFKKQYVEAIFKSKFNFGMENWVGGGVFLRNKKTKSKN